MDLHRARRLRPAPTRLVGRGARRGPQPGRDQRGAGLPLALALLALASLLGAPARAQEREPSAGEAELRRHFAAALAADSQGELSSARSELAALAARARTAAQAQPSPQAMQTWLRSLLHLSWIARELGDGEAARAALDDLRANYRSEAWEVQQALGMVQEAVAQGAFQRAARACEWALAELATAPAHRAAVLLDGQWVLRTLGAHGEADALDEQLEVELDALAEAGDVPAATLAYFEARARLARAQGWLSLGVLDRAATELDRALSAAERSSDPGTRLAAALAYSDMALLSERRGIALQVLDRFLAQHGADLDPGLRASALLQRAVVLSELERVEAAVGEGSEAALRAFLAAPTERGDQLARAQLELVDVLLRGAPDDARRAEAGRLLDGLDDGGGLETAALVAAQRARWLLAGEPGAAELDRAVQATRAAFDALVTAWRHAPRQRPGGLGFLNLSYRRMVITALIDLELARDPSAAGIERALSVVLAAQAEGGLVADLGGGLVDLAALRERVLGPDHGCLVLLPGRQAAHLFAFDRRRLLHRRLPPRLALVPRIDAFLGALYAPPERRARDDGALLKTLTEGAAELAEALLDEELRALLATWTSVTVVGAELFKGLPFECLPAGPRGELLGLTHAVDVTPSLPLAARLAELDLADRAPAALDLLLVADLSPADPLPEMQSLPEDDLRAAVAPLLTPFRPDRAGVLAGAAARWPAVVEALAAGDPVAILHLLAHGAYDPERERGACLALRNDGASRVYAEDVESLPACARLVVLSACAAARGPERLGSDNLTHLGGAFLRAGARCVILTRAQIRLGQTLRLDQALHEHLAAGLPAAEALRRARAAALDDDPFSPYLVGRVQAFGLGALRCEPRKDR